MTFLTQKHLSRRAALRGIGATVALPFLDAMLPASTAYAKVADRKVRLIALEMVHGAAGSTTYGAKMNLWAPAATGSGFDLSGTALADDLDRLIALPNLRELRRLHLNRSANTAEGITALAGSAFWAQAEEFRMQQGVGGLVDAQETAIGGEHHHFLEDFTVVTGEARRRQGIEHLPSTCECLDLMPGDFAARQDLIDRLGHCVGKLPVQVGH